MKNFNEEKFVAELPKQPWEHVYFFAEDPNDMWEIWKNIFVEVLDKHTPLQSKKIRSKKVPWITSNLKKLINTRDKLKRKVISTNLESDWFDYKTSRNKVNIELRNFRKSHSTATALLDCTNDWYMNLDRKMFNLVVLIDLKKAFDTVDHQILLRKLELYGIKGEAPKGEVPN